MKYESFQGFTNLRRGMLFSTVLAWAFFAATPGLFAQQVDPSAVADQAFQSLGLVNGEVVDVLPVATASGGLQVVIPVDGVPETIDLTPVSVRSSDYKVLVQKEDGTYEEAAPTQERNFRGSIIGMADAQVAATYDDTGFRGRIQFADGSRLWVEPLTGQVAGVAAEQHIVYSDEDMAASGDSCPEPIHAHDSEGPAPVEGVVAGTVGLFIAQIAIDADYEYYLDHGSSVSAVETQVNSVINTMNVQYERDVQIRHVITTIIVRSTALDPYSSTSSDTLLQQFRNQWLNNHASVQRDVAQLFTGKDVDSNVIGIAYVGEICTTAAFGLVESDFTDTLAYKTDLSAHELGHNWGAAHCSCASPTPYTMNPSITGANRFDTVNSIPQISSYRDTRSCLDIGDELLRITITSPSTSFQVGQSTQLTATADMRYGADQNVTLQTTWTVDRPEFAQISSSGLLVLLTGDAESCVVVNASYTADGITKVAQKQITIKDPAKSFAMVGSNPPMNAIDARRPTDPNGSNRTGWSVFDMTLNSEPCQMSPSRFTVTQIGGTQVPPVVSAVTPMGSKAVRLTLNKAIDSGAWTLIEDTLSDVSVEVGFLPGDVNGNGTATPSDILTLIDSLNGIRSVPLWSSDVDRSGTAAPADILTIIDLLNGAGGYAAWNGMSLPAK
jgi:hypothetical protein